MKKHIARITQLLDKTRILDMDQEASVTGGEIAGPLISRGIEVDTY